jgi:hypothetical protein
MRPIPPESEADYPPGGTAMISPEKKRAEKKKGQL